MAYLAHPLLTIAGFALRPRVFCRFGYGYGTYALLVIGLSCLDTKNFFGMARYVISGAAPAPSVDQPDIALVGPHVAAGLEDHVVTRGPQLPESVHH
jgi:hypothetical protein